MKRLLRSGGKAAVLALVLATGCGAGGYDSFGAVPVRQLGERVKAPRPCWARPAHCWRDAECAPILALHGGHDAAATDDSQGSNWGGGQEIGQWMSVSEELDLPGVGVGGSASKGQEDGANRDDQGEAPWNEHALLDMRADTAFSNRAATYSAGGSISDLLSHLAPKTTAHRVGSSKQSASGTALQRRGQNQRDDSAGDACVAVEDAALQGVAGVHGANAYSADRGGGGEVGEGGGGFGRENQGCGGQRQ